ncbi:MAG: protein-tyrosine-phosphatase [Planctomycetota bacterium]
MRTPLILTVVFALAASAAADEAPAARTLRSKPEIFPKLQGYISRSVRQFDEIPDERKKLLEELAAFVTKRVADKKRTNLTFICTHNSRRSHLSQVWAQAAAAHYGIEGVTAYSGGTESTAFNPRAVSAVRRAGFRVQKTTGGQNPIYHVRYAKGAFPITNFSKVYNMAPNPAKDFCAVMTCSSADKSCPLVRGAAFRMAIPYEDPKAFDGTNKEVAAYDERCRQISRELLYLFSKVKK